MDSVRDGFEPNSKDDPRGSKGVRTDEPFDVMPCPRLLGLVLFSHHRKERRTRSLFLLRVNAQKESHGRNRSRTAGPLSSTRDLFSNEGRST